MINVRSLLRLMIWVYGLAWAFDYRGTDEGGSPVQFLFSGISLASAGVVTVLAWRGLWVRPVAWLALLWLVYLLSTPVVALLNHVPMGQFVRNISTSVLVQCSLFVTLAAAAHGFSSRDIITPLLISGVINSIWKMVHTLIIAGRPLAEVRIELLSMAQPFMLAFMLLALTLRPRVPWGPVLIGSLAVLAYVLSVTRSAVFILGAAGFGCAIAMLRTAGQGLLPRGFWGVKLMHLAVCAGLLLGTGLVAGVLSPTVYERWTTRLFHTEGGERTEMDPSALTRLAEIKAFGALMDQEPLAPIIGLGVGKSYYWDESYMPELAYTYYLPDFRQSVRDVWFPGHSIWTYAYFSGGVIGLAAQAGLFAGGLILSFRSARLLREAPDYGAEAAWLPFAGLLAYLSLSLTFNVLVERSGGIVLGIILGLPQFLHAEVWRRREAAGTPRTGDLSNLL